MTLAAFLKHWALSENPFRGEEARQDPVFTRLSDQPSGAVQHPDFEKIAGDFARPSTSIVFGEKGSGKTAIRLQIAEQLAAYNATAGGATRRVLLIPYDQLNDVLDRFVARVRPSLRDKNATPADVLKRFRLADHVDGILGSVVPRLVDAALDQPQRPAEAAATIDLRAAVPGSVGGAGASGAGTSGDSTDVRKRLRALDRSLKLDLLELQAVYDRPEQAEERTTRLRRRLGIHRSWVDRAEALWVALGWLAPAAVLVQYIRDGHIKGGQPDLDPMWATAFFTALGVWVLFLFKRAITDRFAIGRVAHRLRKQIRVIPRTERSYARALRQLPPGARSPITLPLTDSDDQRYGMLDRMRRVLAALGYSGVIVLADRIDEPSVISGDVDRMRAITWPLLNNKFLQQDGLGIKLLLPIELRHVLFRESAAFFQEARLDKQSLIEQLSWTGPMLYDLCSARLNACRQGAPKDSMISLRDLFADDVTRADLIDALDQMHQPRDAFKFLYQCLAEHCSNATTEDAAFKVSKAVLDIVRKQQSERIRQLYMGVRPA